MKKEEEEEEAVVVSRGGRLWGCGTVCTARPLDTGGMILGPDGMLVVVFFGAVGMFFGIIFGMLFGPVGGFCPVVFTTAFRGGMVEDLDNPAAKKEEEAEGRRPGFESPELPLSDSTEAFLPL